MGPPPRGRTPPGARRRGGGGSSAPTRIPSRSPIRIRLPFDNEPPTRDTSTPRPMSSPSSIRVPRSLAPGEAADEEDIKLVCEIIRLAERMAEAEALPRRRPAQVTLSIVLRAYDSVLKSHGLVPAEDTRFYRYLLRLCMDPEPDWWRKLKNARSSSRSRPGTSCSERPISNWQQRGVNASLVLPVTSISVAHEGDAGSCVDLGGHEQEYMQFKLVAMLFRKWRRRAHEAGAFRVAAAHFTNTTLSHAFPRWRLHARTQLLRALLHWGSRTLKLTFHTWRVYTRVVVTARVNAYQWRAKGLATRAWDTWHARMQQQKRVASDTRKALAHWQERVTAASFQRWRGCARGYSKRVSSVMAHMRHARKRRWLRTWRRTASALRARNSRAEEVRKRRTRRLRKHCLRTWRAWCVRRTWLNDTLEACEHVRYQNTLQCAMHGWQRVTRTRIANTERVHAMRAYRTRMERLKEVGFVAARRLRSFAMARAFATWRTWVGCRQDARVRARECALAVLKGVKRRCFLGWKDTVARKQQLREVAVEVVGLMHTHARRRFFEWWVQRTQHRIAIRNILAQWRSERLRLLLSNTCEAWSTFAHTRSRRQALLEGFVTAKNARVCKVVMESMYLHATERRRKKRLMQRALKLLVLLSMSKAFRRWQALQLQRNRLRLLFNQLNGKTSIRTAAVTFSRWRAGACVCTRTRVQKARADAHRLRKIGPVLMSMWREYMRERQREGGLVAKGLEAWGKYAERRCFQRWRDFTHHYKVEGAKVRHVAAMWHRRFAVSAFERWRDFTAESTDAKDRMAVVLLRMQNRTAVRAFNEWAWFVEYRLGKRAQYAMVDDRRRARVMSSSLRGWHAAVVRIARYRGVITALAATRRRHLLSLLLPFWRRHARWDGVKRRVVPLAMAIFARSAGRRALEALREHAIKCRLRHRACQFWLQHSVRGMLRHWRSSARRSVQLKLVVGRLMQKVERREKASALACWRVGAGVVMERRAVMLTALRHWAMACQRRCLKQWREYISSQRSKESRTLSALKLWSAHSQRACFNTWKAHVGLRRVESRALDGRRVHIMRRAYLCWSEFVLARATKHAGLARAHHHRTHAVLRRVLSMWRTRAMRQNALRQRLSMRLAFVSRRWQMSTYLAWKHFVTLRRHKNAQANCARAAWARRTCGRVVRAWQAHTNACRRAMRHNNNKRLTLCVRSWQHFTAVRRYNNALRTRASKYHSRQYMRHAMHAWRQRVYLARHIKRCVLRIINVTLGRAFARWVSHARERKALRDHACIVVRRWSALPLAQAFHTWRDNMHDRITATYLVSKSLHCWVHNNTLPAFQQWRAYATDRAHARQVVSHVIWRWQHKLLTGVMHVWRAHARVRAEQKAHLRAVMMRWVLMDLAHAFAALKATWLARKAARACIGWIVAPARAAAFHTWRDGVQESMRVRRVVKCAVYRWQHPNAAAAFNTWRVRVDEQAYNRCVLERAVREWMFPARASAFFRWRLSVSRSRSVRACAASALQRWRQITQIVAFGRWKERTQEAKRVRETARGCVAAWQKPEVAKALRTWRAFPPLLHALRLALHRWRVGPSLSSAFSRWSTFTTERVRAVTLAARVLSAWTNAPAARAYRTWATNVEWRRERREVGAKVVRRWRAGEVAKAFDGWREGARERKRQLASARRALSSWHSPLLSRSFSRWHHITTSSHTSRLLVSHSLTRWLNLPAARALTAWADNVMVRKEGRRVAVKVVSRMKQGIVWKAWGQWRDVWMAKRNDRNNEEVAADFARQRRVHRTFRAWHEDARREARERRLKRRVLLMLTKGIPTCATRTDRHINTQARAGVGFLDCISVSTARVDAASKVKFGLARYDQRLLRSCIIAFRLNITTNEVGRCAIRRMKAPLVTKAFNAWRDRVGVSVPLQSRVAHLRARVDIRRAMRSDVAWACLLNHPARARRVEQYLLCGKERELALAFDAWMEHRERMQAVRTVVQVITDTTLRYAWRMWRTRVDSKAAMRTSIEQTATTHTYLQVPHVRYHTGATNSYPPRCGAGYRIPARVSASVPTCLRPRAFDAWREVCALRQQQRARKRVAIAHFNATLCRSHFLTWCTLTPSLRYQRERVEHAVRTHTSRMCKRVMLAWRDYTRKRVAKKESVLRVKRGVEVGMLRRCFTSWPRLQLVFRAAGDTLTHSSGGVASSTKACFYTWRANVRAAARTKRTARRAIARWVCAMEGRAFATWHAKVDKQGSTCTIASAAPRNSLTPLPRSTRTALLGRVHALSCTPLWCGGRNPANTRPLPDASLHCWRFVREHEALRCWRERVVDERQRKAVTGRVAANMMHPLLARALRGLKDHVTKQREAHAFARKLRKVEP
eukprot:jgi/Chlat1/635/Chrsp103S01046